MFWQQTVWISCCCGHRVGSIFIPQVSSTLTKPTADFIFWPPQRCVDTVNPNELRSINAPRNNENILDVNDFK